MIFITSNSMEKELRVYLENTPQYFFYRDQHIFQTVDYVVRKNAQYESLTNRVMKMSEALSIMDNFVDPSDPDVSNENSIHAYQTAERIRKAVPNDYELQLCGLIHDVGKVLFSFGEPSWAVVGDTFAVGCEFPKSIVYHDTMRENLDYFNPLYKTKYGIYRANCGIENLMLSFGHDEYLYRVLQKNTNHKFSKKYANIIRFHSFYPWHTGGEYKHLEIESDSEIKTNVLDFNQYDLYSKQDTEFVLTNGIKDYYAQLLNTYFPEPLCW